MTPKLPVSGSVWWLTRDHSVWRLRIVSSTERRILFTAEEMLGNTDPDLHELTVSQWQQHSERHQLAPGQLPRKKDDLLVGEVMCNLCSGVGFTMSKDCETELCHWCCGTGAVKL